MEALMKQPDKSIWYSNENRAEAKAVYRMLGNEGFDRESIVRTRREATIRKMAGYGGTILAVQDAAGANCNARLKTERTGYISGKTLGGQCPQPPCGGQGWAGFGGVRPVKL
jgi:hypothetical protein